MFTLINNIILKKIYKFLKKKISKDHYQFNKDSLFEYLAKKKFKNFRFTFVDFGYLPEFEYRIKRYFVSDSYFIGVDANSKPIDFSIEQKNKIFQLYIPSKNFDHSDIYYAGHNLDITSKKKKYFSEKNITSDLEEIKKTIDSNDIDFVKIDLDGMDMFALDLLEKKLKSREILGVIIETRNSYSTNKYVNSFSNVFEKLNSFNYRMFDMKHVKIPRKSSSNLNHLRLYKDNLKVKNSLKGQIIFSDIIFLIDPLESYNEYKLSSEKILKLICITDCFDFQDFGLDLLKLSKILKIDEGTKKMLREKLIKRFESRYLNNNPEIKYSLYLNSK